MENTEKQQNQDNPGFNHFNRSQIERAIIDAQNLVAYTARKGKEVDQEILNTLITAKYKWKAGEWTTAFALQFWEAFRQMNLIIKPATVESVRAVSLEPRHKGFRGFIQNQYGRSEASQTITRYTLWTLGVLAIVLLFQIYWVIGNSLSDTLTELLDQEDAINQAIQEAKLEYSAVEVLFKMDEEEERGGEQVIIFEFYETTDWERETYEISATQERMEAELEVLGSQLDRNFITLKRWAIIWEWLVNDKEGLSNETLQAKIEDLEGQIAAAEQPMSAVALQAEMNNKQKELERLQSERTALDFQLEELDGQEPRVESAADATGEENVVTSQEAVQQTIRSEIVQAIALNETKITETVNWLDQNDLETIKDQQQAKVAALESEKQALEKEQERWEANETLRRVRLSTEFILIILQSYLLPVLYGLLGASVYVLRALMREISNVSFSADRSHLLRMALGTLSGLIIGWFIFLLPGQSIVSSMPPLALAFIVGYNIEIIFTLMDRVIAMVTRPEERKNETENAAELEHTNGETPSIEPETKSPAAA